MFNEKEVILLIKMASQPPCDPWHTSGNKNYHEDSISRSFIDLCKEKLPYRDDKIEIGWSGYPHEPKHHSTEAYWCLDRLGRFHLITGLDDPLAIFQRYTEGDVLMIYSRGWSFMNDQRIDQLKIQLGLRD